MKTYQLWVLAALILSSCKSFDKVSSSDYVGKEFQTESGLKYTIHRAGKGDRATSGDIVKVHYAGRLLKDSSKFDNSYDRGAPFQFELGKGKVIKGWDEGIAMLNVGDSATLIIPSYMGYGEKNMGKIPPNSDLIFDVELMDVSKPAVPFNVAGKDTIHIQDHLKIIWLKKNSKGIKAESGKTVKVHYSGYFDNGKKFDSSVDRGTPLEFELGIGRVIKGWDIGIEQLRTGEKARLIIGSSLAYGSKGSRSIPPNATLTFDVELIEVN